MSNVLNAPVRPIESAKVAPVSKSELQKRVEKMLIAMDGLGIKAAIVTTPDNICYLSGYYTRAITSNTALIVTRSGSMTLVTRRSDEGNYLKIEHESPITKFVSFTDDMMPESMTLIGTMAVDQAGAGTAIGIEQDGIFTSSKQFTKLLAALGSNKTVEIGDTLNRLRWIKSDWELACHRAAAEITVETMRRAIPVVQVGALDSEIAANVAANTINLGSEWVSTWPIILTGAQTGRAHSSWLADEVVEGLPTTLEFSAVRNRYHSPIFRTVLYKPTDEQKRFADAVTQSHQACLAAIKPGARAEEVYEAKRGVLAKFGLEENSTGRAGYTVGIAFAPNWVQRGGVDLVNGSPTELVPGMVFHIVTLVTRPNVYGIAQSSSVIVTANGNEVITNDGITAPILI